MFFRHCRIDYPRRHASAVASPLDKDSNCHHPNNGGQPVRFYKGIKLHFVYKSEIIVQNKI